MTDEILSGKMYIEKMLYIMEVRRGDKEYENIEEARRELGKMMESKGEDYTPANNEEKAQLLVYDAYEEKDIEKYRQKALDALKLDDMCADAYNILGNSCTNEPGKALEYYNKAIEAFEKQYTADYIEKEKGEFFYIIKTRPYIRALSGKMIAQEMLGNISSARQTAEYIMELCRADQMGARYSLLVYLIAEKDWENLGALLNNELFDGEDLLEFTFAKSMYAYQMNGKCKEALEFFTDLLSRNKYILRILVGEMDYQPENLVNEYAPGSVEEANLFIHGISSILEEDSEIISSWLRDMSDALHEESGNADLNKQREKEKAKRRRRKRRKKRRATKRKQRKK
ncbi:MAG: hypothetical protein SVK54_02090 [candidate division WOR-3 bacterium]|nr:hypothetical protein [candidate division WOR-3 bacterium]